MQKRYHLLPNISLSGALPLTLLFLLILLFLPGMGQRAGTVSYTNPGSGRQGAASFVPVQERAALPPAEAKRENLVENDVPVIVSNPISRPSNSESASLTPPTRYAASPQEPPKTTFVSAPARVVTSPSGTESIIKVSAPVSDTVVSSSAAFRYLAVHGGGGVGGGGGGSSSGSGAGVVVDNTAPVAPSIVSPSANEQLGDESVTFNGTAESGTTIKQNITSASVVASGAGGPWSITLILPQGTSTVSFTSTDQGGNVSQNSQSTVFVDSIAPPSPTITSPLDGVIASSTSVSFLGEAEPFTIVGHDLDISTTTTSTSGDWVTTLTLPQGTTTITFVATDRFGNTSASTSRSIFVDSIAPANPTVNLPATTTTATSTTLTFSGTAEAGALISQDEDAGTTTANGVGVWALSLTLAEGDTTISFTATDSAGNVSGETDHTVTVDSLPPEDPIVTAPELLSQTFATTSITFAGTAEALSLVSIETDVSTSTTSADGAGDWSRTIILEEGDSEVTFTATDATGNISSGTTTTITISLAPSAPSAPITTVSNCSSSLATLFCLTATTTIAVSWESVDTADEYEIYMNDVSVAETEDTSVSLVAPHNATSTIVVVARNMGGEASSTPASLYVFTNPLIINEVAWMGTYSEPLDEWMELYNRSPFSLFLDGIDLVADTYSLDLVGTLEAGGLYLLERTDDDAVREDAFTGITTNADLVYGDDTSDFTLDDNGEVLRLVHGGTIIDQTPAVALCGGWCEGDIPDAISMERKDPDLDGGDSTSWETHNDVLGLYNGIDIGDEDIFGTPRAENATGSGAPVAI